MEIIELDDGDGEWGERGGEDNEEVCCSSELKLDEEVKNLNKEHGKLTLKRRGGELSHIGPVTCTRSF